MKKKTFTLIEMLLVVLLIAVLMLLMLRMGWRYVWNMQFRNDKETFVGFFSKAVSQSIATNYYNDKSYGFTKLSFDKNSNDIYLYAMSGSEETLINKTNLNVSYFSGIDGKAEIKMENYKIGCSFKDNSLNQNTGDVNFKLISKYGEYNFCFKVNLSNCKLFEVKCDEKL